VTQKISIRAVLTVLSLEFIVIASAAWVHAGMPLGAKQEGPPSITIQFEPLKAPVPPLTRGA